MSRFVSPANESVKCRTIVVRRVETVFSHIAATGSKGVANLLSSL